MQLYAVTLGITMLLSVCNNNNNNSNNVLVLPESLLEFIRIVL